MLKCYEEERSKFQNRYSALTHNDSNEDENIEQAHSLEKIATKE